MSLLEKIKSHEGFASKPYIDPLVKKYPERYGISPATIKLIEKYLNKLKLTFGYGFTFITEEEAEAVLSIRVKKITQKIANRLTYFDNLPSDVQQMLVEMAYQMGVEGVMKFRKMLAAIEREDWCEALKEGKDSRWYRQTPSRAREVLSPLETRCQK